MYSCKCGFTRREDDAVRSFTAASRGGREDSPGDRDSGGYVGTREEDVPAAAPFRAGRRILADTSSKPQASNPAYAADGFTQPSRITTLCDVPSYRRPLVLRGPSSSYGARMVV